MSLTTDFAAYLQAQGLVAPPWEIKVGVMPPAPDQVVALFAAGGRPTPGKRVGIDAPTLQIRVRGSKGEYDDTLEVATALGTALHETSGLIGATVYPWVLANHPPLALGSDEQERPEFSLNFSMAREAA